MIDIIKATYQSTSENLGKFSLGKLGSKLTLSSVLNCSPRIFLLILNRFYEHISVPSAAYRTPPINKPQFIFFSSDKLTRELIGEAFPLEQQFLARRSTKAERCTLFTRVIS